MADKSVTGYELGIASRIKESRERLGVSITDLGLAYGKNRQTVQHWESGDHFPPLSDIRRLCELLRIDANYLLGIKAMDAITEKEAIKARLDIETAAAAERNRREEAARGRATPGRLRRSTGSTGRFRRPA